jgi:WD40 repeat protein
MEKGARIGFVFGALLFTAAGQKTDSSGSLPASYSAAFYSAYSSSADPGVPVLSIFPMTGKARTIQLPFVFRAFDFDPNGEEICAADSSRRGVFEIKFNPLREILIPGSEPLVANRLACTSHGSEIVISGYYRYANAKSQWGIFKIDTADASIRAVVREDPPSLDTHGERWSPISVSPDGARVVTGRHKELVLIDLRSGVGTSLGKNLEEGAWSPDGRWLAVNDRSKGKTVLLDSKTLTPGRSFQWSHLRWSPDSRYLLGAAAHDFCGPYFSTLVAIDIENGRSTRIPASRCMINTVATGWMNSEITH